MSIEVDANTNRVIFKSPDGAHTFDSNDKNLLITDYVAASFTIDAVNNLQRLDPVLRTQTIVLASVHPLAKVVMGVEDQAAEVRSIGGTHIVFVGIENVDPTPAYRFYPTGPAVLADAIWYHYEVSASQLRVVINYRFCGAAASSFPGATIRIRAWVGTFDY